MLWKRRPISAAASREPQRSTVQTGCSEVLTPKRGSGLSKTEGSGAELQGGRRILEGEPSAYFEIRSVVLLDSNS